ncbi:MAG TPA: hypothetical protein VK657_07625, partial [Terriglobales bacterium]|nr:hypothetical protein [Terriglobales bacterium]
KAGAGAGKQQELRFVGGARLDISAGRHPIGANLSHQSCGGLVFAPSWRIADVANDFGKARSDFSGSRQSQYGIEDRSTQKTMQPPKGQRLRDA